MAQHLQLAPLNVANFIKVNEVKEITDPSFFIRDNIPTPEGLLSNEIFGITKEERANIFGYIDLHDWFMHPLMYKLWSRMDRRVKEIVHGTKKYSIAENGDFVEDPNGSSGILFIKKNINKIKIKSTESRKRDKNIQYLEKYKDVMFMNKQIVIPPFYRDVSTKQSGVVGVGALNKYYSQLIVSVRSLTETRDYGLNMSDAVSGRIQETIVAIYDFLCGTGAEKDGVGLSSKAGLVRSTVMSKTSDFGSRLVLSSTDLKVEGLNDMMVTMDYSAVPLSATINTFQPFVIFNIKRFFENEFGGVVKHQVMNQAGEVTYEEVLDPLVTFSEEAIKKEIKRFVFGYSNRYAPVEIPLKNGKKSFMIFKGRDVKGKDVADKNIAGTAPLIKRRLTWCDVFYMAAVDAVQDKHILITRFPMDSAYNQFPTKVRVATTKTTEDVFVNNTYYQWYPKIREKDIGKNTTSDFIDTMQISNLYLKGIGGERINSVA